MHFKSNIPPVRAEHQTRIASIISELNDDDNENDVLRKSLVEHRLQLETFNSTIDSYTNAPLPENNYIAKARLGAIKREIKRLKLHLPIYARRNELLDLIRSNRVVILKADTGSGKSTQLVQYLVDGGLAEEGSLIF